MYMIMIKDEEALLALYNALEAKRADEEATYSVCQEELAIALANYNEDPNDDRMEEAKEVEAVVALCKREVEVLTQMVRDVEHALRK